MSEKKYIQYSDIIKQFHEALAELDARYQDGTIAPDDELEQFRIIGVSVHSYYESMLLDNELRLLNERKMWIKQGK